MLAFLDPLSRFVNIKRSSPKVNELYLTLASRWISSMTPDLIFSSYPRNIGFYPRHGPICSYNRVS